MCFNDIDSDFDSDCDDMRQGLRTSGRQTATDLTILVGG